MYIRVPGFRKLPYTTIYNPMALTPVAAAYMTLQKDRLNILYKGTVLVLKLETQRHHVQESTTRLWSTILSCYFKGAIMTYESMFFSLVTSKPRQLGNSPSVKCKTLNHKPFVYLARKPYKL